MSSQRENTPSDSKVTENSLIPSSSSNSSSEIKKPTFVFDFLSGGLIDVFVVFSKMRETILGILGRQIHYSNTIDTDCTLYGLARAWTLSSEFKFSNADAITPTSNTYSSSQTTTTPSVPSSTSSSATIQTESDIATTPSTSTDFELQSEVIIKSKREDLLQRRKTQGANKENNKATTLSNLRRDLQKWSREQRNRVSNYYSTKRSKDREMIEKLVQEDSMDVVPLLTLPPQNSSNSSTTTNNNSSTTTTTSTSTASSASNEQTTASNPSISVLS